VKVRLTVPIGRGDFSHKYLGLLAHDLGPDHSEFVDGERHDASRGRLPHHSTLSEKVSAMLRRFHVHIASGTSD
jgi:hypothetical protein